MAETLQVIITADNKAALDAIRDTIQSTKGLESQFKSFTGSSNQATNALSNLSRVAQDAPYGFIGIANNINPLLESFQRLQVSSGSTSSALKEMAKGLIGPAGLGLAVGVVSSLLVVFGSKLFKVSDAQKAAADKAKENTDALKAEKNAIDQIYSSTAKESSQVTSLVAVLQNENETRTRKLAALEQLKKLNPEIFGGLNLEKNAVIGLNTAYSQYINNLSNIIALKIKQKELEDVTEKILKKQGVTLSQEEKDLKATGEALNKAVDARRTDLELRNKAAAAKVTANKSEIELNGLLKQRESIFNNIKDLSEGIKVNTVATGSALSESMDNTSRELAAYIANYKELTKPTKELKRSATITKETLTSFTPPTKLPEGKTAEEIRQEAIAAAKLNSELELTASITGILSSGFNNVFEAVASGQNFGDALAETFKNIIIQMIEMIAKALILRAVLAAVTGGTSEVGYAAGSVASGVSGAAQIGNFVLKGADLVLATQRANQNLNIRRG